MCDLPSKGTASEVAGIVSATIFRKTVNDKRIVIPKHNKITKIIKMAPTTGINFFQFHNKTKI